MGKREDKPKYSVLSNILFMVKQARKMAPSVIIFLILAALLKVGLQTTQLLFTPRVIEIIEKQQSLGELLTIILGFTIIFLLINGCYAYLRENLLFGRIEVRTSIVSQISRKQGTTSYPNIFKGDFRKLLDRSMNAVSSNQAPGEAIWETLSLILENFLGGLVYLFFMTRINPWIIILTIGTTIASFFFSKNINEWGYRNRDKIADLSKEMVYLTERSRHSQDAKDIRIFNMRPWLEEVYEKAFRVYKGLNYKAQRTYLGSDLIDLFFTLIQNGGAYTYLIIITIRGDLNISSFVLLFTAVNGLTQWINKLLQNITKLYKESLEISAIREFLNFKEEFKFKDGKAIEPNPKEGYSLELRNMSFKYPGAKEYTLENINLTISPGEKLAIVGLNGAGKTTLVKLITGLYDPREGEILINGKNLKEFNRQDIYRHFSAVFQESSIIAGSIYENIGQTEEGNIDLGLADRLIKQAGLSERVDRLPKKGHTNLIKDVYKDAVDLSGGELQRLVLARALYKDGPILVLDEPTSALDPIVENEIYLHYNQMTENKTSIFISHRLASTRFCDRIIFIGDGKIVEEGSHEELMMKNGEYANLFNVQSRYYRKEEVRV